MHLYFIRHGESTYNQQDLMTGRQDAPLTDLGREQARIAGRAMAARGLKIDHIMTSTLMRAHDTANLIADEIGFPKEAIQVNDLVIERSFGSLEGLPKGDPTIMTDEYIKERGAELDPEIRLRAQQLLDVLKSVTGNVLVVSHTGFGRRLRAVIDGIPTQDSENFKNATLADLGEL